MFAIVALIVAASLVTAKAPQVKVPDQPAKMAAAGSNITNPHFVETFYYGDSCDSSDGSYNFIEGQCHTWRKSDGTECGSSRYFFDGMVCGSSNKFRVKLFNNANCTDLVHYTEYTLGDCILFPSFGPCNTPPSRVVLQCADASPEAARPRK